NDYNGALSDSAAPVIVTFTVTDACGNSLSATASYSILDMWPPVITGSDDMTVECDGTGILDDVYKWLSGNARADATDDCSAITWSNNYSTLSDGCGETGTATVTFTAIDGCGNASSVSATFIIQDTTAPTFTVPASISLLCDQDTTALVLTGDVTDETDNCSSDLEATYTDSIAVGNCPNESVITRTWSSTDACGNTTELTQTI